MNILYKTGKVLTSVDWRFISIISIIVLALASIPTVVGYLVTPPNKWFSGIAGNVHDTAQYLSWMRESGEHFFIENKLTPEANPRVFVNLHWWIPGRIAAMTGLSLIQIYHLFHVVSVLLYVVIAYWLCGLLFADQTRRRYGLVLTTFTSGVGWIWIVDKYLNGRPGVLYPVDIYTTPGNTLNVATISPHLALALALTLAVLGLAWLGWKHKRWTATLAASILALFLGLGHIYDLVTIWAVLGVFGLLITMRDGFSWDTFVRLFSVVLVSLPAPLYLGWVSSSANPTWQTALAQYDNLGVYTPNPLHLTILLGLVFVIALVAFLSGLGPLCQQSDRDLLIKSWFVAQLAVIYFPFRFQIMLLTGFQLVMAVLAIDGIYDRFTPWLIQHLKPLANSTQTRVAQLVLTLLVVLVLPTNLYLLVWRVNYLCRVEYPFHLSESDLEAMDWLEKNSNPDDIVLSALTTGHFIPGLAGNKAFLANAVMTINFYEKQDMVMRFFDTDTSDDRRQAILREFGVDYVFYGPAERAIGSYDLNESLLLTRVFDTEETIVFQVNH